MPLGMRSQRSSSGGTTQEKNSRCALNRVVSVLSVCVFVGQGLHDHVIEKRAQLKVRMEEEQQKQDLTDSKLCNEQQTSVLRKREREG